MRNDIHTGRPARAQRQGAGSLKFCEAEYVEHETPDRRGDRHYGDADSPEMTI